MNWFATELHCHTIHSDGRFTTKELIETARQYSLDGIALTDHNTISGWADLPDETEKNAMPVLKGIEWTTFFGHMLVMDCPVFVDWRDALPDSIDEKIHKIRSYGGVVGIAHPFELGSPMCTGCYWDYPVRKWENVNYIEVWSEAFPAVNTLNHRAVELWNHILDQGYPIAATHGKDWHRLKQEAEPDACTYIGTQSNILSPADIKTALLEGRTVVSMGPLFIMKAKQNNTEYEIGSTLPCGKTRFAFNVNLQARKSHWEKFGIRTESVHLITKGGKSIGEAILNNNTACIEIIAEEGWYRGELWGSAMGQSCCLAMTSPFYCKSDVIG